jgi:hypothetical protein
MADRRLIKNYGDLKRWHSSEDGKDYRGVSQDLDPVFKHVRFMDDKMNRASRADNPNQWKSIGSIPMSILIDWLQKNHYTMDQWATNEDGAKTKFLKFIKKREFHKLFAHDVKLGV